jgi:transposase InsO family protein
MRYAFIDEHRKTWPLAVMCAVLEVARSGYHAWKKRGVNQHTARRAELAEKIREIFIASRGTYGSPRIYRELLEAGEKVDRKTVAKVMKEAGLVAESPRRFVPATTDSSHDLPVAPNRLKQNFEASAPNTKWCADITYVWTKEGWLYLACVMDCFSRMIVGWSMSDSLKGPLVNAALRMALERRRPGEGLIHHSDRGSQYAAAIYQTLLSSHQIQPSMSRAGCCYDNAMMESLMATLKRELIHRTTFATRKEAESAIFEYIEGFYNRTRRHSSLGYLSPQAFEAQIN